MCSYVGHCRRRCSGLEPPFRQSHLAASTSSPPSLYSSKELSALHRGNCSLKGHLCHPCPRSSCLFPWHTWCFPSAMFCTHFSLPREHTSHCPAPKSCACFWPISLFTSSRKPLLLPLVTHDLLFLVVFLVPFSLHTALSLSILHRLLHTQLYFTLARAESSSWH